MTHSGRQNGAMRFVLGSTSPARLMLLRNAGLNPEPVAPGVDEDALVAQLESGREPLTPGELVLELARAKARAVAEQLAPVDELTLVFGGDSAFELGGEIFGKPLTAERARERWRAQNGRAGTLWSGHCLILLHPATQGGEHVERREASSVASALVQFATLRDGEIDAYIASGEPLQVAGAFTIDSLGGPFIERVEGDPSTVVGLSLSGLRQLVHELGADWTALWGKSARSL